jgi:hypothetical protein
MTFHTVVRTVTVLVCLLLPGLAVGQTVRFGVKGGIQKSSLDVEGLVTTVEAGTGGVVGGLVEIGADRTISFRPEVLLSEHRITLLDGARPIETGLTSFEIPLLICVRGPKTSRVKALLFGGPHLSFITDAWQDLGTGRVHYDDEVEDVDAGVTFGGGAELPAGRGAFLVDARFSIGMRDLDTNPGLSFKVRVFGVHVGYRF